MLAEDLGQHQLMFQIQAAARSEEAFLLQVAAREIMQQITVAVVVALGIMATQAQVLDSKVLL
jgi:hypothetical protein